MKDFLKFFKKKKEKDTSAVELSQLISKDIERSLKKLDSIGKLPDNWFWHRDKISQIEEFENMLLKYIPDLAKIRNFELFAHEEVSEMPSLDKYGTLIKQLFLYNEKLKQIINLIEKEKQKGKAPALAVQYQEAHHLNDILILIDATLKKLEPLIGELGGLYYSDIGGIGTPHHYVGIMRELEGRLNSKKREFIENNWYWIAHVLEKCPDERDILRKRLITIAQFADANINNTNYKPLKELMTTILEKCPECFDKGFSICITKWRDYPTLPTIFEQLNYNFVLLKKLVERCPKERTSDLFKYGFKNLAFLLNEGKDFDRSVSLIMKLVCESPKIKYGKYDRLWDYFIPGFSCLLRKDEDYEIIYDIFLELINKIEDNEEFDKILFNIFYNYAELDKNNPSLVHINSYTPRMNYHLFEAINYDSAFVYSIFKEFSNRDILVLFGDSIPAFIRAGLFTEVDYNRTLKFLIYIKNRAKKASSLFLGNELYSCAESDLFRKINYDFDLLEEKLDEVSIDTLKRFFPGFTQSGLFDKDYKKGLDEAVRLIKGFPEEAPREFTTWFFDKVLPSLRGENLIEDDNMIIKYFYLIAEEIYDISLGDRRVYGKRGEVREFVLKNADSTVLIIKFVMGEIHANNVQPDKIEKFSKKIVTYDLIKYFCFKSFFKDILSDDELEKIIEKICTSILRIEAQDKAKELMRIFYGIEGLKYLDLFLDIIEKYPFKAGMGGLIEDISKCIKIIGDNKDMLKTFFETLSEMNPDNLEHIDKLLFHKDILSTVAKDPASLKQVILCVFEIYKKAANLSDFLYNNPETFAFIIQTFISEMTPNDESDLDKIIKNLKKIVKYEKIKLLCGKKFFEDTLSDSEIKEIIGDIDMRVLTTKHPENIKKLIKTAHDLGERKYTGMYIVQNANAIKNLKAHGINRKLWLGYDQLHLVERLITPGIKDMSPEDYRKKAIDEQLEKFSETIENLFSEKLIIDKEAKEKLLSDIISKAASVLSVSKKKIQDLDSFKKLCISQSEKLPDVIKKSILVKIKDDEKMKKIVDPSKLNSFFGVRGDLEQIADSINKISKGKSETGKMLQISFNVSRKFPLDIKLKSRWSKGLSHFFQPSVLTIGNDGGCCVAMGGVNEFGAYNFLLDADALLVNIMDKNKKRAGMILAFAALEDGQPILALNTVETPFRSDPEIYPLFCDLCMQMLSIFAKKAGFKKIVIGKGYGSGYFQKAYPETDLNIKKMNPFKTENRYYTNAFEGGNMEETPEGLILSYKGKGHLIWDRSKRIKRNKLAADSEKYNEDNKLAA